MRNDLLKTNSDLDIARSNLLEHNIKQDKMFEIRLALINEISEMLCADPGASFDDTKRKYENVFCGFNDVCSQRHFFKSISAAEKIEICRFISKNPNFSRIFFEAFSSFDDKCLDDARGAIAYMDNNYTQSAYTYLSKSISSEQPRRVYMQSFSAVCEEVYSGSCEYCILPIENSINGKLMTFYSMIDKYELKICSVCTVINNDGQSFTKYALLCKSEYTAGIFSASASYLNKRSLEVRVSQTTQDEFPLYDVLKAAEACSLNLQRIDSLPLSYNDGLLGYYIIFSMSNSDIKSFLIYLMLEHPQSYIIGVYSSVN